MPDALRTLLPAAALLAALASAPAAGAQRTTLDFESVATTPAAGHTGPLAALGPYEFFNLRVMSTSEAFGTGANASSGIRFAYAGPGGGSLHRTDRTFDLVAAFLSFRSYDGSVAPVELVVRGWGDGSTPLYERTLILGTTAERFELDLRGVTEVEFDAGALLDGRSAVLAIDDVTLSAVPEPGTVVLVASGLVVVAGMARRRGVRG